MSPFSELRPHPPKAAPAPDRRLLSLAALFVVAVAAFAVVQQTRAQADPPAPFEIVSAPDLSWGFKKSWRSYAPLPAATAGATTVSAGGSGYQIEWAFESGSYDAEAGRTRVDYGGTVHWQKYRASDLNWPKPPGYEGPEADPYLLDVTLSDPQITISRDVSTLTAVAKSRNKDTWEMVEYGRVPIVDLDVLGVSPTVAGGVTQWSDLLATVAAEGAPVFDNTYRSGQVVDEVEFSYAGPGGAPDFSEHWDEPGTVALKLLQNELFVSGGGVVNLETPPWVDRKNLLVHSAYAVTVGGVNSRRLQAFGLEAMHTVGDPLVVPNAQFPQAIRIVAYDTNQNRLLYRGAGESGIARWLKFNLQTQQYESGVFTDPQLTNTGFIGTSLQKLAWDPTRNRGYRVQRVVSAGVGSTEYDNHQWQLITYRETPGGTWEKKSFELPGFGSGQNQNGYNQASSFDIPTYATASDGSLIVLATARTSTDSGNPAPATIPGAYRLTIDEADTAVTVQPLPGTEVPNSAVETFKAVQTSANGHVLLFREAGDGQVVHLKIEPGGQVVADPPVAIGAVELAPYDEWRYAIDPADGMVWFGGGASKKIAGLRGGQFVGAQLFTERNPRGGPVIAGDDHTVYAQTSDGSPAEVGGSRTWGYGKYERLGFVPAVTAQPQPEAAALGVGEGTEEVTFSSAASGDPAPGRQWQVKPAGALAFTDLEGEAGPELDVDAGRDDHGSEYRAVYENAAGQVASAPAALAVSYAPQLLVDAQSVSALEGSPAELAVVPDGNPEPQVSWQRRVGGFWEEIDPGDEDFVVDSGSLTVVETNTEQSGTLFKARLHNSLGTVFSKQAKLTVTPKTTIPPGGVDLDAVSLDWTGSTELQKAPPFGGSSYFSAGTSNGDEASYRAIEGDAVVYQVSPGGSEAVASWPTRAAHVQGGDEQVVRLFGGIGRIEEDGSALIDWDGSFSVNFYGGLLPFTLSDPELEIDEDGDGTLTADLSGFSSSMANPTQRSPLAPVADVTVATFSGVEVKPSGELTIEPDYAGVEVSVPGGTAPQSRTGPGWGAWPQPFVDFHVQTGLAPYWYSSGGGADPYKAPRPLLLDLEGGEPPAAPPAADPGLKSPPQQQSPGEPASIAISKRVQTVGTGRLATLATVSCPEQGWCELTTPRRVAVWIGGRRYWARVFAPKHVAPGDSAEVRLKLTRAARRALGGGTVTVRVPIAVDSGAGAEGRLARVRIRGPEG